MYCDTDSSDHLNVMPPSSRLLHPKRLKSGQLLHTLGDELNDQDDVLDDYIGFKAIELAAHILLRAKLFGWNNAADILGNIMMSEYLDPEYVPEDMSEKERVENEKLGELIEDFRNPQMVMTPEDANDVLARQNGALFLQNFVQDKSSWKKHKKNEDNE